MHRKRIFRYFRYTISAALAISMLLGNVGSSLGITYAMETTQTQISTPIPGMGDVSSSLADGSEFVTETETITLFSSNGSLAPEYQDSVKGFYSVDDGPIKEFTRETQVIIGKGKIADSEITVKVWNAYGVSKTYTYTKKYVANTENTADVSSESINGTTAEVEETVEDTPVNKAAESDAYYATNPNGGVGKEATITEMNDFTQDMLVARCGAWDVPNTFKGSWENSVADCYGLYAAWDDTNLYVGLEMVNTTDTWASPGDGPLGDGGKMSDVPIVLAMNVGNKTAFKTTMIESDGKPIWQMNIEYETRVDHLFVGSTKVGSGTPGLFLAQPDGSASYDAAYCLSYKDNGITYTATDGSISPQIMHLSGENLQVSDVYDISKYQDAIAQGHDRTYDTFYFYTIPLKVLGIDKSYLTSNGIGIMGLGTRQTSALDCIPHDPSMLDNTMETYTVVDDGTSHEKDDLDTITVPLASVGKLNSGGGSVVIPTPTTKPEVTAIPTPTTKLEVTETPTPTLATGSDLNINFGADRCAPQYNTTALEIKAIADGGTAPYSYEIFVDGVKVQEDLLKNTYEWQNDAAGTHKIKAVVTDAEGNKAESEKEFDLESAEAIISATPEPTISPSPEPTLTELPATETPTPTPEPDSGLTVRGFTASPMKVKVGEEVKFNVFAYSGNRERYPINIMYTYIDPDTGEEIIMKKYDENHETAYAFDKSGIYTIMVYVIDATDQMVTKQLTGLTVLPTEEEAIPTESVTVTPIEEEEVTPTEGATVIPTKEAMVTPTEEPMVTPTVKATVTPTMEATAVPTARLTEAPIKQPTAVPTKQPTATPVTALKALSIKSLTTSVKSGKAHVGNTIQLKAAATGGSGNLKYQFSYKYNGKTTIIKAYNTKTTANFKPKKAGTYTLTVKVKDIQGKVVSKSIKSYKVKEKLGVKKVAVSHSSSKLKVKATAQGTETNVRYKFVLKKNGKTIQTRAYKSSKSVTFKNISEGKYSITVYVKDSTKKVAKKTVTYKVKQ